MKQEKKAIFTLSFLLFLTVFYIGFQKIDAIKKVAKNVVISDFKTKEDFSNIKFYKPTNSGIVGKYHNEYNLNRLPLTDKINVRKEVWNLSQNSSGIQIHFITNSSKIAVKYKITNFSNGGNINNIAKNGIDLYVKNKNQNWQFINSGIPTNQENSVLLIQNLESSKKEFILNLPLYNSVESLEIGVSNNSYIAFKNHFNNKIAIYGTSITQGASASRPGLAYTNILSRKLNTEVINLGVSGNAHFEKSIADILCKINADYFIIDATPNSSPEIIQKNSRLFFETLNSCKPNTPTIVLESIIRENSKLNNGDENTFGTLKYIQKQNQELAKTIGSVKLSNIYYIKADSLIGNDTEATVDGTHLNDLGMQRISQAIIEKIHQMK